jgi:hypothetical protein
MYMPNPNLFCLRSPVDVPNGQKAEDMAFTAFARHEQEKEDTVNLILSGATQIQFDDEMSQEDLRWIEQEVYRRSGATCSLT